SKLVLYKDTPILEEPSIPTTFFFPLDEVPIEPEIAICLVAEFHKIYWLFLLTPQCSEGGNRSRNAQNVGRCNEYMVKD
ncbi:11818_t:CDS:2, partial [Acaulospora colombiana]